MTLEAITLRAGIDRMVSPSLNEGGYSAGNRIRFRRGLPEKMRGWRRRFTTPLVGVCRAIIAIYELAGDALLAAGTHNHLYVVRGSQPYDITPVDRTVPVAANAITSAAGSAVVAVVTTGAHGLLIGDFVTWDTIVGQVRTAATIAFNGLSLGGVDFMVVAVPNSTGFSITAANVASASGTYSNATTLTAYMAAGPQDATPGLGWGAGGWGGSGWGLPASQPANTLPARLWSLESWGQILLACPSQGRIVAWSPDSSGNVSTRAAYVTNATPSLGPPFRIGGMTVGMPERHAVAFGCSDLGGILNFDPLLVRFSDVEDYTSWQATALNSAGSFRLQNGSQIMGWLNSTLQTLIWTDQSLWSMRFVGLPYVYSFNKLDGNNGLIGQNARADLGGTVYWMGPTAFWRFRGGTPEQLPCTLQDTIFDNLNQQQVSKILCGTNATNTEIIWLYPSNATNAGIQNVEIDTYAIFNAAEGCWYGGALDRTAWMDRSALGAPIAVSPSGVVYDHETGADADGAAMGDYIESGYFDLEDGENQMFLSGCIPDFTTLTGTALLTIKVTDYPSKAPRVLGPFTITPTTKQVPFRARGRQACFRLEGGGIGATWRLGKFRMDSQADGKR